MHMCARTHTYLYIRMCVQKYIPTDRSSAYLWDYQISIHLYIYIDIYIYMCIYIYVRVSNAHYIYKVYTRVRAYPFVCDQHTFSYIFSRWKSAQNRKQTESTNRSHRARCPDSSEPGRYFLETSKETTLVQKVLSETMHGQFWILSIVFGCLVYIYI